MSHDYTQAQLRDAIAAVGARAGDTVFVMSNLGFFGVPEGGLTSQNAFRVALGAFDAVLGRQGTLSVPAFTYSFCKGEDFEPAKTATKMGLFAESVRKLPESLRSDDPIFSVAARGPKAALLTEDAPEVCFGPGSFWERLLDVDAIFVHLGFHMGPPLIHYIERKLGVSYRADRGFTGYLVKDGKREQRRGFHFGRVDTSTPGTMADARLFESIAERRGLLKRVVVGRGFVLGMRAREFPPLIEKELKADPIFLTVAGQPAAKEVRA